MPLVCPNTETFDFLQWGGVLVVLLPHRMSFSVRGEVVRVP